MRQDNHAPCLYHETIGKDRLYDQTDRFCHSNDSSAVITADIGTQVVGTETHTCKGFRISVKMERMP